MAKVSCEYLVTLSVEVDTDTGEVLQVRLCGDDFQSVPSGSFVPADRPGAGISLRMREVFLGEADDRAGGDGGYAGDGESALGDRALAIADRVRLLEPEAELQFALQEPDADTG